MVIVATQLFADVFLKLGEDGPSFVVPENLADRLFLEVEEIELLAKAAVILPGLIWQKEIWQLHIITLFTSAALIWVSERKLLPTMVAFNTLWIGLSSVVIVRNLI